MRREKLILGVFLVIIIFVFFDALLGLKVFYKNFNDDMFLEQIEKTSTKKNIKEDIPVYVEEWTKDIFHNRSGVYNSWFKLTGITKFENGYKAIINGEILDEMSYIRGFSVEEITKNRVKLERNDYQVTLNLEE
jgi:hypothetical protein